MTDIQNPTTWSDFDFLEFEAFVSKVENEGFTYAAENYGPNFESPELQAIADDLGLLRTLYVENEAKVEAWWLAVGPERACDLHNDHIDEERQRREDARLFGIRCTDEFVITEESEESRARTAAYLLENRGKGWRVPAVLPPPADRAALDRVRALHLPKPDGSGFPDGLQCRTCSHDGGDGYQYLVPWPCPTVEAVDEELRRLAAEAQPEPEARCTCGGTFPLRHLHADTHEPAAGVRKSDTETPFVTRVLELFSLSHADAYGDLFWRVDDGEVRLFANVSDVFAWGGSDCEPITLDTLPALEQAYTDLKAIEAEEFTAELYAARQRGVRPQGAAYPSGTHEAWRKVSALYDACGPERELGLGNPKAAPAHAPAVSGRPAADDSGEESASAPVHAVPLPGSNGISACCGRPPCEFVGERVTRDPGKVTCPGPVVSQPGKEA